MHWKMNVQVVDAESTPADARRFVLHRHHDAHGPHLDLRLEQDGYLMGWRVEGLELNEALATEKAPHPLHWLDQDGEAVRTDVGVYTWVERKATGGVLDLWGSSESRRITVTPRAGLPVACVEEIVGALVAVGAETEDAARLIRDGAAARARVVERFCGLGRELDGACFDATTWRGTLGRCSLEEIHRHLRAYEVRLDEKYPPAPISRPEPLETDQGNREKALAILGVG